VQRLFSTFPNAWPGAGLLLLRLVVAVPAIADGSTALLSGLGQPTPWIRVLELAGGTLLLLGLWTPVGAVLLAVSQAWLAFGRGAIDIAPVIAAAVAVSLIMLGPGAWSADARLYGRKRLDLRLK